MLYIKSALKSTHRGNGDLMNTYKDKKHIFIALALSFALSITQITYPVFDWLDTMRDKLSEPIMGKVTKGIDKKDIKSPVKSNGLSRRPIINSQVTQQQGPADKKASKEPTSPVLDIAEVLTQAYCTEGIETPINRIGAHAAVKTGYQWFGRQISSRQALPQLAQGVLVSSVMFAIHNLAAYFLYPDFVKNRWWVKGFADSFCSSMVMGLASSLFGTSLKDS